MTQAQREWDELISTYPPGTVVRGEVVACEPFGVFVRLDLLPDVTALLEVVQFESLRAAGRHAPIQFPVDYPPVGSRVEARVLAWSERPKEVRLTQLPHHFWSHAQRLSEEGDSEA